jgi:metal-responsive CopG/Arc/MetJ family transcriptional regulator
MQAKSIELPEDLYLKVGTVARERFETAGEFIKEVVSNAIREELELKDIKRQIASKYAAGEISYESLKTLLGSKEAERIRIYKETILESLKEADYVAKRSKE